MILLLDNFDSFTYNLVDYFRQLGLEILVVRNDSNLSELICLPLQAIILSPGHGVPKNAGCMMEVIAYFYRKIPILGICLGHQALGEFFGASLQKASMPMHGKISTIQIIDPLQAQKLSLFYNLPQRIQVVRYHSLLIVSDSADIEVLAITEQNEIMAFKHKTLPIYGLQFHPEAVLTEFGIDILRNWRDLVLPV
jgi:anthranilate synthase component 2